jgi:hypothetical protein
MVAVPRVFVVEDEESSSDSAGQDALTFSASEAAQTVASEVHDAAPSTEVSSAQPREASAARSTRPVIVIDAYVWVGSAALRMQQLQLKQRQVRRSSRTKEATEHAAAAATAAASEALHPEPLETTPPRPLSRGSSVSSTAASPRARVEMQRSTDPIDASAALAFIRSELTLWQVCVCSCSYVVVTTHSYPLAFTVSPSFSFVSGNHDSECGCTPGCSASCESDPAGQSGARACPSKPRVPCPLATRAVAHLWRILPARWCR